MSIYGVYSPFNVENTLDIDAVHSDDTDSLISKLLVPINSLNTMKDTSECHIVFFYEQIICNISETLSERLSLEMIPICLSFFSLDILDGSLARLAFELLLVASNNPMLRTTSLKLTGVHLEKSFSMLFLQFGDSQSLKNELHKLACIVSRRYGHALVVKQISNNLSDEKFWPFIIDLFVELLPIAISSISSDVQQSIVDFLFILLKSSRRYLSSIIELIALFDTSILKYHVVSLTNFLLDEINSNDTSRQLFALQLISSDLPLQSSTELVNAIDFIITNDSGNAILFGSAISASRRYHSTNPLLRVDNRRHPTLKNRRKELPHVTWNEEFQRNIEMSELDDSMSMLKFKLLTRLSMDFVKEATDYGRLIISELYLPIERRTIKPLKDVGVAGGDKFLVLGDVLFKIATDVTRPHWNGQYLYGGPAKSDEFACKAAGKELRGASSYFTAQSALIEMESEPFERICVPMQILIDYRGFRAVAMPFLPISIRSDPVYGSRDAALSVFASDRDFNQSMQKLGEYLHLKGHFVKQKLITGPVDCEGHIGTDGRRYLLDLSRVFPPESPSATPHLSHSSSSIFYRLLRPEFLMYLKLHPNISPPLSSDAFSSFGVDNQKEHNAEVHNATLYMVNHVIPFVASWLESTTEDATPSVLYSINHDLAAYLHHYGVPVRHLGLIRSLIDPNSEAAAIVLAQMTARTFKNLLRRALRNEILRTSSEYMITRQIVNILNLITGAHLDSDQYWENVVIPGLHARFGTCAFDASIESTYSEPFPASITRKSSILSSPSVFTTKSNIFSNINAKITTDSPEFGPQVHSPISHLDIANTRPQIDQVFHHILTELPPDPNYEQPSPSTFRGTPSPATIVTPARSSPTPLPECCPGKVLKARLIQHNDLFFIIKYILSIVGKVLTAKCELDCRNRTPHFQFTMADVIDGAVRVKHMPFISFFQGKLLASEGLASIATDAAMATRLLALSCDMFNIALQADPTNPIARRDLTVIHDIQQIIELASSHGLFPLTQACLLEKTGIVKLLVGRHGVKVNAVESDGKTALFAAVHRANYELVRYLLGVGANPNCALFRNGSTPLLTAVRRSNTRLIQLLLDAGADVNYQGCSTRRTPLIEAANIGNTQTIELLLNARPNLDAVDIDGKTALFWVQRKNFYHAEALLSAAFAPRVELIKAIRNNDITTVSRLSATATLDFIDDSGRSPLIIAIERGNVDIVTILLNAGAREENALICAIEKQVPFLPIIQKILEIAKPNTEIRDANCYTVLMYSAKKGLHNIVEYLCQYGADLEAKDSTGSTPLSLACEGYHYHTAEILLNHNANSNTVNEFSWTPLHRVSANKKWKCNELELCQLLLRFDANPSITNRKKKTVLHYAFICNHVELIRLLLPITDASIIDNNGKTALEYVRSPAAAAVLDGFMKGKEIG